MTTDSLHTVKSSSEKRSGARCLAAVIGLLAALVCRMAYAGLMWEDFDDGDFDHDVWKIEAPSATDARVVIKSGGLNIQLPARPAGKGNVIVRTRTPLNGDFTITAVYSLKALAIPTSGFANCELAASNASHGPMAALRQSHDKQGRGFALWHEPPKGKGTGGWTFKKVHEVGETRAALRLRRRGATVDFGYRPGPDGEFVPVGQFEYGTEPITEWEFRVTSSFATTEPTDVTLHSLAVDADGLDLPPAVSAKPKPASQLPSLILFTVASLLAAFVGWQLLVRRGTK